MVFAELHLFTTFNTGYNNISRENLLRLTFYRSFCTSCHTFYLIALKATRVSVSVVGSDVQAFIARLCDIVQTVASGVKSRDLSERKW